MSKRSLLGRSALAAASLASLVLAPMPVLAQSDPGSQPYDSSEADVPAPPPPPSTEDQLSADRENAQDDRDSARQQAYADRDRQAYERRYARAECVQKKHSSAVTGAVIGGILGAVVGSQMGARGVRTEAGLMGAGVGALAGGAIGSSSAPPCPDGYERRVVYDAPPPDYYDGPPPAAYYGPPPGYYYDPGPSVSIWYGRSWGPRPYGYYGYRYGR